MDKFTQKALEAINSLSDEELTLEDACDYKKINFEHFNLRNAAIVETGGFVPFGKNLDTGEYFLSIKSFRKMWEALK